MVFHAHSLNCNDQLYLSSIFYMSFRNVCLANHSSRPSTVCAVEAHIFLKITHVLAFPNYAFGDQLQCHISFLFHELACQLRCRSGCLAPRINHCQGQGLTQRIALSPCQACGAAQSSQRAGWPPHLGLTSRAQETSELASLAQHRRHHNLPCHWWCPSVPCGLQPKHAQTCLLYLYIFNLNMHRLLYLYIFNLNMRRRACCIYIASMIAITFTSISL